MICLTGTQSPASTRFILGFNRPASGDAAGPLAWVPRQLFDALVGQWVIGGGVVSYWAVAERPRLQTGPMHSTVHRPRRTRTSWGSSTLVPLALTTYWPEMVLFVPRLFLQ